MQAFRYKLFIVCFLILIFQNVSAQVKENQSAEKLSILTNDSLQYSLYLPANFENDKYYPLLIFLDPSARGDYPVKQYKKIADTQEVILAGSLNSKNFDPSSSFGSTSTMLQDITSKFKIDKERIWLAGFSGGSRAASSYAAKNESIKGVIACGAGFSDAAFISSNRSIAFAGLVGYKDMNFEEMIRVNKQLTEANKESLLLFFDGDHMWPPEKEMSIAVQWLMKEEQSDKTIFLRGNFREIESLRSTGYLYMSWMMASENSKVPQLFNYSDSLKRIIESTKGFSKDKAMFENVLSDETAFLDEFSFLFGQAVFSDVDEVSNIDTWKSRINTINTLRKNKNGYKKLSGERLFDFTWRLCIEQYNWLMTSQQYKQAYKAATILSFNTAFFLKPEFLMARAAAGSKDSKKCINHLKYSIKNEKLSKENILNDGLISDLFTEDELSKLFNE